MSVIKDLTQLESEEQLDKGNVILGQGDKKVGATGRTETDLNLFNGVSQK